MEALLYLSLLLVFLTTTAPTGLAGKSSPHYLHQVTWSDLRAVSDPLHNKGQHHPRQLRILKDIRRALQKVGALAVTGLGEEYSLAVEGLQHEGVGDVNMVAQNDQKILNTSSEPNCQLTAQLLGPIQLEDGTRRFTRVMTDDFEECPSSVNLRTILRTFDQVESGLVRVLAENVGNTSLYVVDSDIYSENGIADSMNLRYITSLHNKIHLHTYVPAVGSQYGQADDSGKKKLPRVSLPFHVDNGLYLFLTPSQSQPLLLKNAHKRPVQIGKMASSSSSSYLLFLLGRGLTDWLLANPAPSTPPANFIPALHAVPALSAGKALGNRTVLARMKVAGPNDLPAMSTLKKPGQPLRFADMFLAGGAAADPTSLCHHGGPLTLAESLTRTRRATCWPHTGELEGCTDVGNVDWHGKPNQQR